MLVLTAQTLSSLPQALQQEASQFLATTDLTGISVTADGRDLVLDGSIDRKQPIAPLLDALQEKQAFIESLAGIDTALVAFQPGSNSFTPDSDAPLRQLAGLLRDNPDQRIRIEGHTDDTGPAGVNLRLSQERAEAVARYLQTQQVSQRQLIAKGYGSTQPIDDNSTEAGRARNRRIEISYVD
jgi:outer membrane protein OmpA-like peptidoglycan-associated protein